MILAAADQTLSDVTLLIDRCCHRYWPDSEAYGVSYEELRSVAHEAYCKAFNTYEPSKASYATWVYWKVRGAVKDFRDRATGHRLRYRTASDVTTESGEPILESAVASSGGTFEQLWPSLSEDARAVAQLLIDLPDDLETVRRMNRHNQPELFAQRKLCRHLKGLGWRLADITKAFAELKEALRDWR